MGNHCVSILVAVIISKQAVLNEEIMVREPHHHHNNIDFQDQIIPQITISRMMIIVVFTATTATTFQYFIVR